MHYAQVYSFIFYIKSLQNPKTQSTCYIVTAVVSVLRKIVGNETYYITTVLPHTIEYMI